MFYCSIEMFHFCVCVSAAVPPVVPELLSDDDATHFDDIPEPDSGEEFFPIPKVHKVKCPILFALIVKVTCDYFCTKRHGFSINFFPLLM